MILTLLASTATAIVAILSYAFLDNLAFKKLSDLKKYEEMFEKLNIKYEKTKLGENIVYLSINRKNTKIIISFDNKGKLLK